MKDARVMYEDDCQHSLTIKFQKSNGDSFHACLFCWEIFVVIEETIIN